jgi:hypothetical protein
VTTRIDFDNVQSDDNDTQLGEPPRRSDSTGHGEEGGFRQSLASSQFDTSGPHALRGSHLTSATRGAHPYQGAPAAVPPPAGVVGCAWTATRLQRSVEIGDDGAAEEPQRNGVTFSLGGVPSPHNEYEGLCDIVVQKILLFPTSRPRI